MEFEYGMGCAMGDLDALRSRLGMGDASWKTVSVGTTHGQSAKPREATEMHRGPFGHWARFQGCVVGITYSEYEGLVALGAEVVL
jgi:hypothetical protein